MEKLKKIIEKTKCSVTLTVNDHRDHYMQVEEYLDENVDNDDIKPEIRDKMIQLNTMITLQWYPSTPGGFYILYHYDIDEILQQALDYFNY